MGHYRWRSDDEWELVLRCIAMGFEGALLPDVVLGVFDVLVSLFNVCQRVMLSNVGVERCS
jgi:hypothetical protein